MFIYIYVSSAPRTLWIEIVYSTKDYIFIDLKNGSSKVLLSCIQRLTTNTNLIIWKTQILVSKWFVIFQPRSFLYLTPQLLKLLTQLLTSWKWSSNCKCYSCLITRDSFPALTGIKLTLLLQIFLEFVCNLWSIDYFRRFKGTEYCAQIYFTMFLDDSPL